MNKKFSYSKIFDELAAEILNILKEIRKNNQALDKKVLIEYLNKNETINQLLKSNNCDLQIDEVRREFFNILSKVESILPNDIIDDFKKDIDKTRDICEFNSLFIKILNAFATYLIKVINTFNKVWDVLKETLKFMEVSNDKIFDLIESSKEVFIEEIKNNENLDLQLEKIEKETKLENDLENLKKKLLEKLSDIKKNLKETQSHRKHQLKKLENDVNKVKEEINKYKMQIQQLQETIKQFKKEAIIDTLTSIYNRNFLEKVLPEEFEKFKRYNQALSVIMLDIDDFKKVNDNFGHQVGDNVLRYISTVIKNNIRKVDIPFRYGGEEFLVILPHTNLDQALVVANRICKELNETLFKIKGLSLKITASIGVTEARDSDTVESLIKRVDDLLLKAKKEGKNRVLSG
ncbi:diguanylate cyclase [Deferribacter thermophilus]|uniref:diguanylate cyclase n=1 Tax=Deferribacter thermophilus TaxID=53573 RepID=UPI003C215AC9